MVIQALEKLLGLHGGDQIHQRTKFAESNESLTLAVEHFKKFDVLQPGELSKFLRLCVALGSLERVLCFTTVPPGHLLKTVVLVEFVELIWLRCQNIL
jgi:hypothetical protein